MDIDDMIFGDEWRGHSTNLWVVGCISKLVGFQLGQNWPMPHGAERLICDLLPINAGMSEWFMEPVLKTGDPARDRGFESHSRRHTQL